MMGNYAFSQPVVPITANNDGLGGNNSFMWIFALLILSGGGLGGFGNRGNAVPEISGYQLGELAGKVATKDSISQLQNSTNQGFAGLSSQSANETLTMMNANNQGFAGVVNASNQGFAGINTALANGFSSTTFEIANRISALATSVSECCCAIKTQMAEGFGQVRYDMANFTAQTNSNIAEWGNKILMDNSRRAEASALQRINQLEIQNAICGIPKVSNNFTYPAPNPYSYTCGNHCGC